LNISLNVGESIETLEGYYERRKAGQGRWVGKLKEAIDEVSATPVFKENVGDKPIGLTEVPFFDVELVGIPALYYLGSQCFTENPSFTHLMQYDSSEKAKVLICGGKGNSIVA
jgi:arsenite-transporting ATPase